MANVNRVIYQSNSVIEYHSLNFFFIGQVVVAIFDLLPLYSILLLADRIFSRSLDSICYVDVEQYLALCVVAMFFE